MTNLQQLPAKKVIAYAKLMDRGELQTAHSYTREMVQFWKKLAMPGRRLDLVLRTHRHPLLRARRLELAAGDADEYVAARFVAVATDTPR